MVGRETIYYKGSEQVVKMFIGHGHLPISGKAGIASAKAMPVDRERNFFPLL